jgi:DNA modification methylase
MIQMWDGLFSTLSPDVKQALLNEDGNTAFLTMHAELDKVWRELARVLKPGAIACINIGDATRTIGDRFRLYSNHARIIEAFRKLEFDTLPAIIWRKQTNAPNKFMGSGMLPGGAYVTLEHEYILVFRKGAKREFRNESEKALRMKSAYFWEERNTWFSDVWDFKGTKQRMDNPDLRKRSAAYPFELAYRLVNMYSAYGDTVLDPFAGTGTTTLASIACARNSVAIEIEPAFSTLVREQVSSYIPVANEIVSERVSSHKKFVAFYEESKGPLKYVSEHHGFRVMTRQEIGMQLFSVAEIKITDMIVNAVYEPFGKSDDPIVVKGESLIAKNKSLQQDLDF